MIRIIKSYDECRDFVLHFQADPCFSDPMLTNAEQVQCNLVKSINDPDKRCAIGVFQENQMVGLFAFLVLRDERYIEMLVGLSREKKAYLEVFHYLEQCYPGYRVDFVFNPGNYLLKNLLENRKAEFEPEQQKMVLTKSVQGYDTIRYNICLGEVFSETELNRAVKLSGVELFLPSIVGGIDGSCGEDGANLSGGQKQRIALARALIRGVDFLILDEGVSAIDIETANKIEQELLDMEELTLLSITHRIKDGLIHRYDRVLSMSEGRIIERVS